MLEPFVQLFLFGLGALVLCTPVLALIAFFRARRLERRVETLERELLRARTPERTAAEARTPVSPRESSAAEARVPAPAPPQEPARVDVPAPVQPTAPPHAPRAGFEPAPLPRPRAPRISIDWERWIGVRGAAVAGGVLLALAGIYFLKYSIQRGWIQPPVRVAFAALAGVATLVGAEFLRKRRYRATADALSGAGAVILYAAVWAARVLYELVPPLAGFALMCAVTIVCGVLAMRHASQLIALFGLLGGFATPILLSQRSESPLGLFIYLLLLDVGLLAVAHKHGWSAIGLVATLGTFALQALWLATHRASAPQVSMLAFIGLNAALFSIAGALQPQERRGVWVGTQVVSIVGAFAFAAYFGARVDLGPHVAPIAVLLALLSALACWIARREEARALPSVAAIGSGIVVGIWVFSRTLDLALAWELVLASLALVPAAFLVLEVRAAGSARMSATGLGALLASAGLLACSVIASSRVATPDVGPWIAGFGGLAVVLLAETRLARAPWAQMCAAAGVALGWYFHTNGFARERLFLEHSLFLHDLVLVGSALVFAANALIQRVDVPRRWAWRACALAAILLQFSGHIALTWPHAESPFRLVSLTVLALVAALASAGARSGAWYALTMVASALTTLVWTARVAHGDPLAQPVFWLVLLAAAAIATLPALAQPRLEKSRLAWLAAALAPLAFQPALRVVDPFEARAAFVVPLALAVVGAIALLLAARTWPHGTDSGSDRRRTAALAWLACSAAAFASFVVPTAVDRAVDLIGAALFACATALLWRRFDRVELKLLVLALACYVGLRELYEFVSVLRAPENFPRTGWPLVHWASYSLGVPALALLAASLVLGRREVERARAWELPFYAFAKPLVATLAGLIALAGLFLWLNVEVLNLFSSGDAIAVGFERRPARDLALSIAWALYALALLVAGMRRASRGLRWISLVLLLVTLAKVFLHDLGQLEGLYRVGSLIGLALALIAVSLLYQRVVFRAARAADPAA